MKRKNRIIDVTPTSVEITASPRLPVRKSKIPARKEKIVSFRSVEELVDIGELISENIDTLAIGFLASLMRRK